MACGHRPPGQVEEGRVMGPWSHDAAYSYAAAQPIGLISALARVVEEAIAEGISVGEFRARALQSQALFQRDPAALAHNPDRRQP